MKLFIKVLFFFVLLYYPKLIAEENFCLDKEGFIYPLFESDKCEKKDEKINQDEFSFLIEIDNEERIVELFKYREIQKKIVEKNNLNSEDLQNLENKENIKEVDNQKIAKLANELKIKNKKENIKNKKKEEQLAKIKAKKEKEAKRKLEAEKRKQEAEKKRLAIKKQKELERKNKLAEQKRKREEAEKQRLAEKKQKEIEKKQKIADKLKIKEEKERIKAEKEKHKNKIILSKNANNNLKIIFYDKKIVKNENFPKINPSKSFDYEAVDNINKTYLTELFTNNSNLIIIIPKDFETFSTISSENEITSKYVAGTRSVPNPEFNRVQMELRRAERELINAQRNEQEGFRRSQCMACGLIVQWGGLAIQDKWQKEGRRIQNRIESLTRSFSSTPQYLDNEVLRSYNYVVQNIDAEKIAKYQIIQSKNYNYLEKNIIITKNKKFKIAYNIEPQDKNYENLLNKYNVENDILQWQNQKLKNISVKDILSIIEQENSSNALNGKNELYSSLNFKIDINEKSDEELSWWEKLLGNNNNKRKNTALKNNNKSSSSFEVKDERFDSVVIVKTENGLGSGFFVSKDEILTNYHVIENSSNISIVNRDNKKSSAVVIKKDLKRDLALLKTNFSGTPVKFYEGKLKQGEQVDALGHPKGRKFSLTKGWISAIRLESSVYNATNSPNVLFIQTDAAINPGNSGGPLFYKDRVIGVNTQGLSKEASEGMNFAVHFSEAKKFLDK